MIDEKILIKVFENRIDVFLKQHPEQKDCAAVQRQKETIQLIEAEAKRQKNGWIPCSEKLPEDGKEVLVWYEYFRYGNYNCMYQTFGIGYQFDGFWSGDVQGHKSRCIAWQPLPEQYKEN